MKYFSYILLSVVLFSGQARSQNENDRWIFGGHPYPVNPPNIDFGTGTPTAVSNSPIPYYYSTEAAAAVADRTTGALLFYSDALKVFTTANTPMPNGGETYLTNLNGCNSATQGALIIPRPGVANHYYLFTVDCTEDFNSPYYSGLSYSEIDMTLNGGLGDVVSGMRNILLWGPPVNNKVTEKLTAARNSNGDDYWVVIHEWSTNNFLSFAVTCNGISLTPVISSVGTVHTSGSAYPNEVIGAMKISPDQTRLALVAEGDLNLIEIFDFDAATGMVSNPITLTGNTYDYGVEFSPNSQRLYITVYYSIPCCSGKIYQYNLAGGTAASINSSRTQIASSSSVGFGGLQLGPDNKIYVSRVLQSDNLGVISNPNNASGFSHSGPSLLSRRSNIGLINLVSFQPNPVCLGASLPVDLLYFNAEKINSVKARLHWATASEINNDYFKLEKSFDGKQFLEVAKIKGSGNSSRTIEYSYTDNTSADITYYRLTQFDFNGKSEAFKTIAVKSKAKNAVNAFYDYNSGEIQITMTGEMTAQHLQIFLYDLLGNICYQQTFNSDEKRHISVQVPYSMQGIYFLKMADENLNSLMTKKIAIN